MDEASYEIDSEGQCTNVHFCPSLPDQLSRWFGSGSWKYPQVAILGGDTYAGIRSYPLSCAACTAPVVIPANHMEPGVI